MPLFSIIIPTFNAAITINAAIESILDQTLKNFEILIIDGLSQDNTIDLVNGFEDERIRLYVEKDNGVYDAMNKGIAKARGEWIYFLGSDDSFYSDEVLDGIYKTIINSKANVIYGNVIIIGSTTWAKDGDVYDGPFSTEKILQKNICHQAIFYKKSLLDQIGNYNLKYTVCADWDYNLRAWAITNFQFTNQIIAEFNVGGISSTKDDVDFRNDYLKNILSYFNFSIFDKIINKDSFPAYQKLSSLQKYESPIKYYYYKALTKIGLR